ncbi:transposase [Streptomyces europaeiscabiei]|uniref:transposase n=1 Tax=Streptomyces europaeiscabiei TaxID=146819 RepID=UPI0029B93E9B|nr:transposase [Streptomyces europaeiscabiei]MDX3694624.1 transposase [Streptomyces europaeiscabiei]
MRLWEDARGEFSPFRRFAVSPFRRFDTEFRGIVFTMNAIESVNARIRRAAKTRGHSPSPSWPCARQVPSLVDALTPREARPTTPGSRTSPKPCRRAGRTASSVRATSTASPRTPTPAPSTAIPLTSAPVPSPTRARRGSERERAVGNKGPGRAGVVGGVRREHLGPVALPASGQFRFSTQDLETSISFQCCLLHNCSMSSAGRTNPPCSEPVAQLP